MDLRGKLINALAWAGLVVVVGVPSVDLVLSKFAPGTAATIEPATAAAPAAASEPAPVAASAAAIETAPATVVVAQPQTGPVEEAATMPAVFDNRPTTGTASTAVVVPAAKPVVSDPPTQTQVASDDDGGAGADVPADPVGAYLAKNKTLPSYLTPDSAEKPAPEGAAAVDSAGVPAAVSAASTQQSSPQQAATTSPAVPDTPAPAGDAQESDATLTRAVAPIPMPASSRPKVQPPAIATEADLKDWKSGTLADYLKQHNLLSPAAASEQNGAN